MTEIDWYPGCLREKPAQVFGLWDRYEATTVSCDLDPDPQARNDALRAINQLGGLVYACRVVDGLIKIGWSNDLATRRRRLKGQLLGFQFGSMADEMALHAQLARHVHHGREWYNPTSEVLAVVNEMRERLGLEPVQ